MGHKKNSPMRLNIPLKAPRNPLVAAAKTRKAGSHQASHKSVRQQLKLALKKSIDGDSRLLLSGFYTSCSRVSGDFKTMIKTFLSNQMMFCWLNNRLNMDTP